jgi:hypothetical protein
MAFTAKDVQALRQATGAGMMDAKKALEANDGEMEASKQWLREKGLAASAKRDDRENTQGLVALLIDGNVGAMVKLKSETDFVAASDLFKAEAEELVKLVVAKGEAAVTERAAILDDLKITLKEKIELGEVVASTACSSRCRAPAPSSPTTWPCTSASLVRSTWPVKTCRPTWWRRSGRRSRPSAATRASRKRRCPRSSKVG